VARHQFADLQIHTGDRDADDRFGGVFARDTDLSGNFIDGVSRPIDVELDGAVAECRGTEKPGDDKGVGDGRAFAAQAIASGARGRSCAFRADLEDTLRIDPGDGAAAFADGGDGDGRDVNRKIADHLSHAILRRAVADDGDVGAGPADIEAHGGGGIRSTCDAGGADHAGSSAGQEHLRAFGFTELCRHDAAVRFRQHGFGWNARALQGVLEGRQVMGDARLHVSRDNGGHRTFVLADDGPDIAGAGHG